MDLQRPRALFCEKSTLESEKLLQGHGHLPIIHVHLPIILEEEVPHQSSQVDKTPVKDITFRQAADKENIIVRKHSTMMPAKEKRVLSMANATWDRPEASMCTSTRVETLEHFDSSPLLCDPSLKHMHRPSKHQRKISPTRRVNKFRPSKDIDQLLSLLRDPSFCQSRVNHDSPANPIPKTIRCDSEPSPEQQPTTDKLAPGQTIIPSSTSACSLDSCLSDDSTPSRDCSFVRKRCEIFEADRDHFFLRAESSSLKSS